MDKEKPVVVLSGTAVTASVVWFALRMEGFYARLYSKRDWDAETWIHKGVDLYGQGKYDEAMLSRTFRNTIFTRPDDMVVSDFNSFPFLLAKGY